MRLRFTLGPVQELVAKSRRTRDLWAGSFLLSYLSGCAMAGAAPHGRLILPLADGDPLYERIRAGQGDGPSIGSLPNRFELDTGEPEIAAQAAKGALDAAWRRICGAVWEGYLAEVAREGHGTRAIFDRQVGSFWEIQWVAADEDAMMGLLERRKHWRSRIPTVEPGDKCAVMPELQELSGFIRAHSGDEAARQKAFWQALRRRGRLTGAELREHERLSAVALVKRLYARHEVAEKAIGWDPGTSRWRSTVYVAAKPWIDEVAASDAAGCEKYAAQVSNLDQRAPKEIPAGAAAGGGFARLDGNYFFVDALANAEMTLPGVEDADPRRAALRDQLQALYRSKGPGGEAIGPPASFYALLLMDGDQVGRLLHERGPEAVSRALASFTREVGSIVEKHRGYAIYAGGDDVLAMLPVPSALECAWKLREAYQRSFGGDPSATTSAAVVFAQIRRPLREVLEEAHHLLDDVAKDGNGRDSLAVSLLRGGDRSLEWVSTWDEPGTGARRLEALSALTEMWRGKAARRREGDDAALVRGELSTGLLYRVRDLMGMLCGWPRWQPGVCAAYAGGDPAKLLAAEIRRAYRAAGLEGEDGAGDAAARDCALQQEAEQMARLLLGVSHPATRDLEGRATLDSTRVGLDGALLAHFLSGDGKERDHGVMEASR